MCEKSGILIQTAYQRTVPIPIQKRRTVPTYRTELPFLHTKLKVVNHSSVSILTAFFGVLDLTGSIATNPLLIVITSGSWTQLELL